MVENSAVGRRVLHSENFGRFSREASLERIEHLMASLDKDTMKYLEGLELNDLLEIRNTSSELRAFMDKLVQAAIKDAAQGPTKLNLNPSAFPTTSNHESVLQVPARAERLLIWFLPKHKRAGLIGDLEEEYRTIIVPKLGERAARRWYWFQAVRSTAPVLKGWILKTSIGGGIVWLFDWVSERLG